MMNNGGTNQGGPPLLYNPLQCSKMENMKCSWKKTVGTKWRQSKGPVYLKIQVSHYHCHQNVFQNDESLATNHFFSIWNRNAEISLCTLLKL